MAQLVQLVVFDLDGTLVDSRHDIAAAANDMIRSFGGVTLPEDEIAAMVGEGAGLLVRRALRAAGLDRPAPQALERYLSAYDGRLLDTTVLYHGMRGTLDALASRFPLAVLTNKPEGATRRLLDGLGVTSLFRRIVGGDTSLGRKPAPAGLLDIVAAAGVAPAGTLMVGDSPIDLQTARAAGTRICLARYGFGFRFDGAGFSGDELFIDRPRDLIAVVNGSAE
jgi:phosphoglycolate phosphatase